MAKGSGSAKPATATARNNKSRANPQESAQVAPAPKSLGVSRRGVRTGEDFANFMSALMSDAIEGSLEPKVINAACKAGGMLLKVVEMQYRFGPGETHPPLRLAPGSPQ